MIFVYLEKKERLVCMTFQVKWEEEDHKGDSLMHFIDNMSHKDLDNRSNGYNREFYAAPLYSSKFDTFRPLLDYLKRHNFELYDYEDKKITPRKLEFDLKKLFVKTIENQK